MPGAQEYVRTVTLQDSGPRYHWAEEAGTFVLGTPTSEWVSKTRTGGPPRQDESASLTHCLLRRTICACGSRWRRCRACCPGRGCATPGGRLADEASAPQKTNRQTCGRHTARKSQA